ncbi:MAG: hypothetical protein ACQCN3_13375 [Candidatus Bathyarchaeia archaeon]
MKRTLIVSVAIILVVVIGLATVINYTTSSNKKTFYVGVTYGGNSIEDAKVLIDKVKDYTNLFVIQSGALMSNWSAMEQICDYAVNNNLNLIVYYGNGGTQNTYKTFLDVAPQRWGSHLLGVYYNDEQGGKMIDLGNSFYDNKTGGWIEAHPDGPLGQSINDESSGIWYSYQLSSWEEISISHSQTFPDHSQISNTTVYFPNGTVTLSKSYVSVQDEWFSSGTIWYYPNGIVHDVNGTLVTDAGDRSQFDSYEEIYNQRPLQTHAEAANFFVGGEQNVLSTVRNISDVRLFTSDYALYWFDYLAGYDTVFAQLGWNNTVAQEIGLVRGAANLQDKDWGAIITWKYDQPPYLASGDEIYQQMKESYECGAKYVTIFNYAEDMTGPYGTLQEEHFQALERFWNNVVQNNDVVHGGIKAEAALVLPADYGWGMRRPDDSIWGLWDANDTSTQIWSQLQSRLEQFGTKLDIVYDDAAFPIAGKYNNVFYWNQTD